MNVMIRKTTKEDVSSVFKLLRDSWLDTYVDFGIDKKAIVSLFSDEEKWISNFKEFLDEEDAVAYVAVDQDRIVGSIFGVVGRIQSLYVAGSIRRGGCGRLLLEKFIESGLPVRVSTLECNKPGQNFYLKNHFKPTDEYTYFSIGDEKYKDLLFELE